MRIAIISTLLLSFLSCKKDKQSNSNTVPVDTAQVSTPKTDTLTAKPPQQEMFSL
ncbi:hypothetical protein QWZ06_01865 [Chryseobacterium tructae]|uniref:hypothetical protein n=1 Tax=Chryseobacterium tructae TaxID=1037380 RepID=UPI0025B40E53|nr:hypothetical protein [Chryseobacterium tructae]MDN3691099.1 hypothetical protein [Chryseobacterium tructae]